MNTLQINQLLALSIDDRTPEWDNQLCQLLLTEKLLVVNPEPIYGPDSWPYLHLRWAPDAPAPDAPASATESFSKVLNWAFERGIGLILDQNDKQDFPDLILSWGQIWSFLKLGTPFINTNSTPQEEGQLDFNWNEVTHFGPPTDEYLPKEVKKILIEFLAEQAILIPKILIFSLDKKNYHLAFSLESFGSPPPQEHEGILEALSWFFPPHYQLALISEQGAPPAFVRL